MKRTCIVLFSLSVSSSFAQAPASMKQLMLDLIHPAANEILLFVNRGEPKSDSEWAAVRRSALTLEAAGALLTMRGAANDQGWAKDAKLLGDAGAGSYKAAQAKDLNTLAALSQALDASCTTCHKQYRPNIFPPGNETIGHGASK